MLAGASAMIPATSGELALVPQTSSQPPSGASRTDTGVSHAPTADMSLSILCVHPLSVCHAGFAQNALHPLPVPSLRVVGSFHTLSDQPRAFPALCRAVPPTEITLA